MELTEAIRRQVSSQPAIHDRRRQGSSELVEDPTSPRLPRRCCIRIGRLEAISVGKGGPKAI